MSVKILEEALCIESVLSDKFSKFSNDSLNVFYLLTISLLTAIFNLSSSNSDFGVKILLKTLLCEDLIDLVAEVSPSNMLTSLLCLESLSQLSELLVRDWDLAHTKTHSELATSNMS